MDADIRELIESVHRSPGQIVLTTAGAGAQALCNLLAVAGASRTLLESIVPYSKNAFIDFLGYEPKKFVSLQASTLLAGRAFVRAQLLANSAEPLVGISCTATIATDRPKRGAHRAYVTAWSRERVATWELVLDKGARSRYQEEQLISRLILNSIAEGLQHDQRLALPMTEKDQLRYAVHSIKDAAVQLHEQEISFFGLYADGRIRSEGINPQLLLCGSFNPLHAGHVELAQAAAKFMGRPVAFELSAFNVDKPPIPYSIILDRLQQFAGAWPIYVTNAPTFVEKSRMFNNTTFVVGFDTARRVVSPRYYNDSEEEMLSALAEMQAIGCRFLVAGRVDKDGAYKTVNDMQAPEGFESLFIGLEGFRVDLSSSEIRGD